jgi:hypothetical protein
MEFVLDVELEESSLFFMLVHEEWKRVVYVRS